MNESDISQNFDTSHDLDAILERMKRVREQQGAPPIKKNENKNIKNKK